jgi:hypothetical protein
MVIRASVLDCASPLALWPGQATCAHVRMKRHVFCGNALAGQIQFKNNGGWPFLFRVLGNGSLSHFDPG